MSKKNQNEEESKTLTIAQQEVVAAEELQKLNITHIITAIAGVGEMYPTMFKYHTIDICDRTYSNIKPHFDECSDFIDNDFSSSFVCEKHCAFLRLNQISLS